MEFFVEIRKEKDFVSSANKASSNLLNFASYFLEKKNKTLSKIFHFAFVKESMEIEDFLDDNGVTYLSDLQNLTSSIESGEIELPAALQDLAEAMGVDLA